MKYLILLLLFTSCVFGELVEIQQECEPTQYTQPQFLSLGLPEQDLNIDPVWARVEVFGTSIRDTFYPENDYIESMQNVINQYYASQGWSYSQMFIFDNSQFDSTTFSPNFNIILTGTHNKIPKLFLTFSPENKLLSIDVAQERQALMFPYNHVDTFPDLYRQFISASTIMLVGLPDSTGNETLQTIMDSCALGGRLVIKNMNLDTTKVNFVRDSLNWKIQ